MLPLVTARSSVELEGADILSLPPEGQARQASDVLASESCLPTGNGLAA